MKSGPRASAIVVLALATMMTAACSGPAAVPPDYHRIGAAGSDVLYAKIAHESDGDWADVLVRSKDGDTLCNARGPLMTGADHGIALCSDETPGVYVYVAQTSKTDPANQLCRQNGQPVVAQRLTTDKSWHADFIVSVDRSDNEFPSVSPCSALTAQ